MKPDLINHIKSLRPLLDVHGKWAWIGNHKTCSHSIGNGPLKHKFLFYRRGYTNWRVVWNELFAPRIDEVFLFAFVRNPWDRVCSAFFFLQERKKLIPDNITFAEYVKTTLKEKGVSADDHFEEQTPIFSFKGEFFNTFLGRFESLEEDWAYIAEKINVRKKLPHYNGTSHNHYTSYYDDECIEIVGRLYKEEIDALDYKYETKNI